MCDNKDCKCIDCKCIDCNCNKETTKNTNKCINKDCDCIDCKCTDCNCGKIYKDDVMGNDNLILPTEIDGKKITDPFDMVTMAYTADQIKKCEKLLEEKKEEPKVIPKLNKKKGNNKNKTKIVFDDNNYDYDYDYEDEDY